MRPEVEVLASAGPMPEENDDLMLWEWWGEAVERLVPPATDQEARAVAAALPLTDGSGYGAAWALLHFIETAPGWPLTDVVEGRGGGETSSESERNAGEGKCRR